MTPHSFGREITAEIQVKFSSYPLVAQKQLEEVRRLIFAVAEESALGAVEESLKWGKPKDPDVIKVYFHCQTSLVEIFREIYPQDFDYQGKRAIVLPFNCLC